VEPAQDRHRQVLAHLQTLRVAEVVGGPLQFMQLPVVHQPLVTCARNASLPRAS
jgi:hypothetical protein